MQASTIVLGVWLAGSLLLMVFSAAVNAIKQDQSTDIIEGRAGFVAILLFEISLAITAISGLLVLGYLKVSAYGEVGFFSSGWLGLALVYLFDIVEAYFGSRVVAIDWAAREKRKVLRGQAKSPKV